MIVQRLSLADMFGQVPTGDMTGRSVRGGLATFASQAIRFALQTASTVVLARILVPDDYGLVAMAAVVINFAEAFRDAGLGTATVQRDQIRREQIDLLFWVNLAISALIALCVGVSAPVVAMFFNRPELAGVTAVSAIAFILNGTVVQHSALLQRHMRFAQLSIVTIAAQATAVLVSVVLAILGFGYWSLVLGSLASAGATALLVFYYCPFIPRLPKRGVGIRDMVKFGGNLTGFAFVNYFARNADNLLIGRFLGAGPLGLYSRAYSLFMLPIGQIRSPLSQVALPVLCALREDPARYRRYFMRVVEMVAVLSVPIAMYCAVEGKFVVRLVLGTKWLDMVPTFRVLTVAGILQSATSMVGLVFVSQGRADKQLRNGVVNSLVVVAAFACGLPFGILGVAVGYAVASYVLLVPMLWYAFRDTPLRLGDFWASVIPSLSAALAASSSAWGVVQLSKLDGTPIHLLAASLFFAVYCGLSLSRHQTRDTLREVLRHGLRRAVASVNEGA